MKDAYSVITQACIGHKEQACVQVCPCECIYEGDDQFFIHPLECIDCGACVAVCPTNAIYSLEKVPQEFNNYIQKARVFFGV
jgi:NAD-dependent dihydropyrimidine dehydrogenase PreA subunit